MEPRLTLIRTGDGSLSLLRTDLDEPYHSRRGALAESMHVFIKQGLDALAIRDNSLHLLEIGFGTGLNAALALDWAVRNQRSVVYTGIEKYPVPADLAQTLENGEEVLKRHYPAGLHTCAWNDRIVLNEYFSFLKRDCAFEDFEKTEGAFDIVFFDAFAPGVQPELWTAETFTSLYHLMARGGLLVTYCAKGDVRRTMLACGFMVERLTGPPGKREMLRAVKLEK